MVELSGVALSLGSLAGIVRACFGPNGGDILIAKPLEKRLTGSCGDVLSSVKVQAPLVQCVLRQVKSLSEVTGDGAGRLLLLVAKAVQVLAEEHRKSGHKSQWVVAVLRELSSLERFLHLEAPDILLTRCGISVGHFPEEKSTPALFVCARAVARTAMQGRFSPRVEAALVDSVLDWVRVARDNAIGTLNVAQVLRRLRKRARRLILCDAPADVRTSRVVADGFLLEKDLHLAEHVAREHVSRAGCFVVVTDCNGVLSALQSGDNVATLKISDSHALVKAASAGARLAEDLVTRIRGIGVHLILFTERVPPVFTLTAAQQGLLVVQCVNRNDAKDLCGLWNLNPIADWPAFLEGLRCAADKPWASEFVGVAKTIRQTSFNGAKALFIARPNGAQDCVDSDKSRSASSNQMNGKDRLVPVDSYLRQLVVCGPSRQLTERYKGACHALLATLQLFFDDVCKGGPVCESSPVVIPGGGIGEKHLWTLTNDCFWSPEYEQAVNNRGRCSAFLSLKAAFRTALLASQKKFWAHSQIGGKLLVWQLRYAKHASTLHYQPGHATHARDSFVSYLYPQAPCPSLADVKCTIRKWLTALETQCLSLVTAWSTPCQASCILRRTSLQL